MNGNDWSQSENCGTQRWLRDRCFVYLLLRFRCGAESLFSVSLLFLAIAIRLLATPWSNILTRATAAIGADYASNSTVSHSLDRFG